MTIFKKNNLQDIIKNIKKKKKFSGGDPTHPTEDDIEEQNIAMESNNIKEYKKKLLDNIFNKFVEIINTLNKYTDNTLNIDSFIKLKKIENDYIKFYDILKDISKIKYKKVKNSITGKIPFENYSEMAKNLQLIASHNIAENLEDFYKSHFFLNTKLSMTRHTFNKLDNYKEVFDEISSITKRYDVIKKKDDKDDTDINSLYTGIYKITYSLYVIIYIEKNNQYKYFIFKNEIEKNININKEYYSISEIKYDKDSNVDINAINIGEILIKSLDKIEEYNIYYKKKEEIIKDKINECNDPGVKNNIDFGTIQINKYNDFIDTTNGTLLVYNSSKLIEYIEKNTSLFVNITKNMKECALFSLAFYNSIKEYNKFYNKEYYKNENNILPKLKLLKNGDDDISIGFTNLKIENIIAENDRNINKYILKYLNITEISIYKNRDNNNSKLKNIIKGYNIINRKKENFYNKYENEEIRKDFEKKINLAEYDYYNDKINPQSTKGGYLYYNEPQYIEQKYENINEKNLKENAITVIKEINNYIPIFTGGGGSEETKKFIKDKISLLESDLKKLIEDIEKFKKDTSLDYKALQNDEKKEYYKLTKLSSLKETEKVDNFKNKGFEKKIKIFDITYKEIEKLAKIIERNIIAFYQSTKITEDIDSAKKDKEDKGADGAKGADDDGDDGDDDDGDAKGAADDAADGATEGANDKNIDDDIHKKPIRFEIITRLFNMAITFIMLVIFLIYISIFCISLLNMLIYIIIVINDILINIFNDDVTIYESLGYKIVKYIDVQLTNVSETTDDKYKLTISFFNNDKDFYNRFNNDPNNETVINAYIGDVKDNEKKRALENKINTEKNLYEANKFTNAGNPLTTEKKNDNTVDKGSLNKEPYFYALLQQNIIYIMTDFLTAILFAMIILILLYMAFLLKAFNDGNRLDGDINNPKTLQLSIMFFVFLLFITLNIVLYKYLFSDILFEKLVDIKKEHNVIDEIIFKLLSDTDPHINKDYCEELKNNINDMDNINRFFMDDKTKAYLTTTQEKKIVQMAFLYCLYSYLYEIVPNSNKSAISLIDSFIIAPDNDNIRDSGYLSFASFLSNSSSTNAIKKYYFNLGIFSDDTYLNDNKTKRDNITNILKKKIEELNEHLLNIPEQKIPLILLGLYFLINLILNFIGLIVISYLIAKDKDLAPEFRLFPLELSDILSKILLNIPFASTLFNIIPVENKN